MFTIADAHEDGQVADEEVEETINEFDANGNGLISYAAYEFR